MSESDAYVLSKFKEMGLSDRTDMLSKEVAWIPDSNGSSYNGSIVFDLSSLGQTNKWLSYGEAIIEIPYVIAAKATTDMTGQINENSIFMKDGFHQLIDSCSVEFNQKTVCQVQNFTNVHTQFKLLSSSSVDDVNKNGPSTGFFASDFDDGTGYMYKATADISGIGYVKNNSTTRKTKTTAFNLASRITDMPLFVSDNVINSGRSYFSNDGGAADARYYYWVVMAQIRLKDITDFFDKIPLCKTTDIRLTIQYNSAQVVMNIGPTATFVKSITSYQQISGHVCPFETVGIGAEGVVTIRSNVVNHGLGGTAGLPKLATNQCRLYVPLYKVADSVSLAMVQSFPTTKFEYNDIYTFTVPSVAAGAAFTQTLTTGIVNPQYVVVIPLPKTNSLAGLGVATYQSIFDSCPGTFNACILQSFNLQIAGLNVFQQDARYDWEMFQNEVAKINALNGNCMTGLTSGVLSLDMWQKGYRCYVADVSRREQSNDNVTKSVVVTATNGSSVEIELLCFVGYKKEMSIKTSTGTIAE